MRKGLFISLFVLLVSAPVSAQTVCSQACVLGVGDTFSVAWDAPVGTGGQVDGYKLYLDGKILQVVPAVVGTTTFTVPSVSVTARGGHVIKVSSYNGPVNTPDNEVFAADLNLTAKLKAPLPPGGLRLLVTVVVAEDGSVVLKVVGVEP